jgi:thioredoxin reductase (NADPH)
MTEKLQTDVVIIGAGPVGLFAVFECGMAGFSCHVVDALGHIGGQCTALYPEKPIYDIPGCPEILAGALIENLEKQAAPFSPVYHLGQTATGLRKSDEEWRVAMSGGAEIAAKAVIIAGGGGSFGPQRPPLPGIEDFEGKSVFYSIRSREMLRGKKVVIAGGGDSAVDWAVSLSEVAGEVHVVHRRDKFRASPANVEKLHALAQQGKIILHVPAQLTGLEGENGQISTVVTEDLDGKTSRIAADVLLPFFGLSASLGGIAEWGIALDGAHILAAPETMATSLPGVYAIGDIASYPGKLKLILTGFSEAAQAARAVFRQCHPGQDVHAEYSTTRGIPKT